MPALPTSVLAVAARVLKHPPVSLNKNGIPALKQECLLNVARNF